MRAWGEVIAAGADGTRGKSPGTQSFAESELALAALASLCAGEREAVEVLRRLSRAGGRHRDGPRAAVVACRTA